MTSLGRSGFESLTVRQEEGRLVRGDRAHVDLTRVAEHRRDSDLFGEGVRAPEAQAQIAAAMERGLQTRDAELDLELVLGE